MIHAVKDGTRLGASLMSEFVMFSASSVMYLLREKNLVGHSFTIVLLVNKRLITMVYDT